MLLFLLEAILISLSGVMAPGPMTAVTVGKGNQSPHAGALIAVGHGIVEFPLMVAIFYGLGPVLDLDYTKAAISSVGGLLLLMMGVGMLRSMKKGEISSRQYAHSPVLAGILLSLGNPYFFIWWATVGATLISNSVDFGLLGFLLFAPLHWLCDFVWSYLLSALSFRGGQFFGKTFQQVISAVCGVFLLFFSGKFIADAIVMLLRTPPTS
jgi:threonine/homoserine/homoserine lactone efflux protein